MSTSEEQLLIAVLKQVDTGRLDFEALAAELGCPTKGAAQKRWQRFQAKLKAAAAQATADAADKPAGSNKNAGPSKAAGKKRKYNDEGDTTDEPTTPILKKRPTPRKPKAAKAGEGVKEDNKQIMVSGRVKVEEDHDSEMMLGGPSKATYGGFHGGFEDAKNDDYDAGDEKY